MVGYGVLTAPATTAFTPPPDPLLEELLLEEPLLDDELLLDEELLLEDELLLEEELLPEELLLVELLLEEPLLEDELVLEEPVLLPVAESPDDPLPPPPHATAINEAARAAVSKEIERGIMGSPGGKRERSCSGKQDSNPV